MSFRARLAAVVALGFAAATITLLLSDRVPLLVPGLLDLVFQLGREVDSALGFELVTREQIPGTRDEIGHALLWGSGTFALGLILWGRMPILAVAAFMLALSIGSELAQRAWTTSRTFSDADLVANAFGIVGATIAVVLLGSAFDATAAVVRRLRRPRLRQA